MLFLLSGASAAGKTTIASAVGGRVERLAVHELGEFSDQPWDGEPGWLWRRSPVERAVKRAHEYEREGTDMLLTEGVLGELLAAPSAVALNGIAPCLVDCNDGERLHRLRARESGEDAHTLWNHLVWALWLRRHAEDPRLFRGPVVGDEDGGWAWDRWSTWRAGDPRWSTFVIDTSTDDVYMSAARLIEWIAECRGALGTGRLPLSGRWWQAAS